MQLVLPAGQEGRLQQQALQQAAQQVLAAWPECRLQRMQLLALSSGTALDGVPGAVTAAATAAAAQGVVSSVEVQPYASAAEQGDIARLAAAAVAAGGLEDMRATGLVEQAYLQPVVPTPPNSSSTTYNGVNSSSSSSNDHVVVTSNSSASSSTTSTPAAATAELWLPAALVQQLWNAGFRSVRVVVTPAQLPAGQLLLDNKTWQLPSSTAAAGYEEDTAAAAAEKPLQLQLPVQVAADGTVDAASAMSSAIVVYSVLSVTVLVGGSKARASMSGAAAADTTATGGFTGSSAEDPAAAHVLAKLPLLVLPAAAAEELQQLYTALVEEGASCSTSYQKLLPLLQGLAAVLCQMQAAAAAAAAGCSGTDSATCDTAPPGSYSSTLTAEVARELAAYFTSQGMPSCLELLQHAVLEAPVLAGAIGDIGAASETVAGILDAGAAAASSASAVTGAFQDASGHASAGATSSTGAHGAATSSSSSSSSSGGRNSTSTDPA
jgi:hypothetical protein